MKGDFTRDLFDPTRHYSGVLMQQGRVQLDADWNAQDSLQRYRAEVAARDVIGASGGPLENGGFAIQVADAGIVVIRRGRYYVEGILCENEEDVRFDQQPDFPNPPALPQLFGNNKLGIVYLDVWTRHISALEDPAIREVALGGADTTTRLKTVWQVKVLPVASQHPDVVNDDDTFPEWDALVAPGTGGLSARAQPLAQGQQGPCLLAPNAGYRRLENQLYRVEVHKGGALGIAGQPAPTFKWSRDNGTVVTSIEKFNGQELTLHDVGRDEVLGFAAGQLVEVVDDAQELSGSPGQLFTIAKVNAATRIATLSGAPAAVDASRHPRLRRWDSATETPVAIPGTNGGFIALEDGVEVKFSNGSFRTGDYWQIPARTATADIEWPFTAPQPARGVLHHYARLAFLRLKDDGTPQPPQDARRIFRPLTPTPLALHVKGINWPNDDFVVLETLTQGNVGLRILLDSTFNPNTVNSSTMVVTLETVLPATPPKPNSFLHVDTVLAGQITLDPSVQASPDPATIRTIVWKLPPAFDDLNALLAQAVDPPRVWVRLNGSAIWSDDGARLRYLDGHSYGRPGRRADDNSFRVDLGLPTGTDALASDFESWFFLKKIIPPATLIAMTLTEKVVAGGTIQAAAQLDRAALADTSIALSNSNPEAVTVPASIVIPAGKDRVQLQLTTAANLGVTTQVKIDGRLGASTASGTFTVEVVSVSVTPPQASLFTGRQQQFSALVTGTDNTAVNWSAAGGGSVTSTGIYTAPGVAGTFQVIATSVEDSRKAASSQVVVTVKPKEGKESKDTKETGKEFTKEKEIRAEKIAENKLRDVIGTGIVSPLRTAPDAATTGTGQPFIQAAERPALDGSVAPAPTAQTPVADEPIVQVPAVKKPLARKPVAKRPSTKKPAAKKPATKKPAEKKPTAKKTAPSKSSRRSKDGGK